jgi:hypothetical protein
VLKKAKGKIFLMGRVSGRENEKGGKKDGSISDCSVNQTPGEEVKAERLSGSILDHCAAQGRLSKAVRESFTVGMVLLQNLYDVQALVGRSPNWRFFSPQWLLLGYDLCD